MKLFWTVWVIDFIAALVIFYFFVIGIMDGSVSSYNAGEWFLILFVVAGVLTSSFYFINRGRKAVAYVLLSLLAIPAIFMAIFMLIMLFGDVHWQ